MYSVGVSRVSASVGASGVSGCAQWVCHMSVGVPS